jgi:hypothetical protein
VLNEIAVAESLKCNEGETDLILFGKDNFGIGLKLYQNLRSGEEITIRPPYNN